MSGMPHLHRWEIERCFYDLAIAVDAMQGQTLFVQGEEGILRRWTPPTPNLFAAMITMAKGRTPIRDQTLYLCEHGMTKIARSEGMMVSAEDVAIVTEAARLLRLATSRDDGTTEDKE